MPPRFAGRLMNELRGVKRVLHAKHVRDHSFPDLSGGAGNVSDPSQPGQMGPSLTSSGCVSLSLDGSDASLLLPCDRPRFEVGSAASLSSPRSCRSRRRRARRRSLRRYSTTSMRLRMTSRSAAWRRALRSELRRLRAFDRGAGASPAS